MDIGTKNVFFNVEYLINYSTDHITTKPIRKIDFFNFNNILPQITIKQTVNKETGTLVDSWTGVYNVLILMNVRGPISQ